MRTIRDYALNIANHHVFDVISRYPDIHATTPAAIRIVSTYLHLYEHALPYNIYKIARWLDVDRDLDIALAIKLKRKILAVSTAPEITRAKPVLAWLGFTEDEIQKALAYYTARWGTRVSGWSVPKLAASLVYIGHDIHTVSQVLDISHATIKKTIESPTPPGAETLLNGEPA